MSRAAPARSGAVAFAAGTGALLGSGAAMLALYAARHPGELPVHVLVPLFYNVPLALAFAVIATAILRRLPGHPVGWLFALVGGAVAASFFAEAYAAWRLPGLSWVLWSWTILTGPICFGLAMALLLFPTGRPPSPGWRWLARLLWAYLGVAGLVCALAPWPRRDEFLVVEVQQLRGWPDHNPVGWEGPLWLAEASALVVPAGVVLLLGSALSLLPRWRRSAGDERQQVKWLGLAALLLLLELIAGLVQALAAAPDDDPVGELVGDALFLTAVAGLPVALGLGIVRYRLYDIDVIISRTLVYSGLAGFIALSYVASVVVAGELIGRTAGSSTVLALAATAGVAAGVHPLRTRLQTGADRLVFGRRAAPYELMAWFGHQLAQASAPPEVLARIAETAGQAARARAAQVTVSLPDGTVRTGSWPAGAARPAYQRMVPVHHAGEPVGEIAVAGAGRPGDLALLRQVAAISAGALRNLRLLAELESLHETIQAQNGEIAASRDRLAAAAEPERRRLERQVGQRIGPDLAALRGALPRLSQADPDQLAAGCHRLSGHAAHLVEELRALSRGVLPPVLVDHGLVAALRALLRRLDYPVTLEVTPPVAATRFPAPVETTAYLCCRAALEAAGGAGRTDAAQLRLWCDGPSVAFTVGHAPAGPASEDLAALGDRAAALGGELAVVRDDRRTTVTGRLPVAGR